jgi:hypothetical protein
MFGLASYIKKHPKKNYTGFIVSDSGRTLTDKEVRIVANYCVKNGIEHLHDCPDFDDIIKKGV